MSKELTGKVEYITLNQMFDIIKDEVKGKCRKGTKFPQKEDGGLKEKYSLALNMWQHWYEEYKQLNEDVDKLSYLLSKTNKGWEKTIKETKKLQEQLKEANDALFSLCSPTAYSLKPAMDYLNKWGVK